MKDKNLLRIVVLISGRGTNLQAIIKACNKNIDAKVVGVISNQINAAGLNIAHKNKIGIITLKFILIMLFSLKIFLNASILV